MMKKSPSLETHILFSLIQAVYGTRVSEDELEEIRSQVGEIMESIERVRSIPLNNDDEPALRFTPYRRTE